MQDFKSPGGQIHHVIKGVSFDIYPGEIFSLVGESGSGKSTIGKDIIGLNKVSSGNILYHNMDLAKKLSKKQGREIRKSLQMIYQDPLASLNPSLSVGSIVAEGLDNYKMYSSKEERDKKISDMLLMVGLGPHYIEKYPHHLSGGQRQRVGIARSLIMNPDLIIADECISALDVSVQAQVVNLLRDIRDKTNTAILFIAHDLSMVKYISDRIAVLNKGNIVEIGRPKEIFDDPQDDYTKSLIDAIPDIDPIAEKERL